jgi:uncharacterized membrane protein YbhN (UPF0104 family)
MESALKSLRNRIPILIGLGLLTLLAYKVVQLWDEVAQYVWGGDCALLGLSLLILAGYCVVLAFAWQLILRVLGASLGWTTAAAVYFYSNLMRYIPGTFWYIPGRVHLSRSHGVVAEKSSLSLVLESYLELLSALLVGGGALVMAFGGISVVPLAGAAVLLLLGLRPVVFLRVVNAILRRIGREEIALVLPYRQMVLLLLPYLASWALYGLAFWVLLLFLRVPELPSPWATASICALSWVAGFLALPVPQGLGVREAVLTFLLSNYMPVAVASLAALLWRLCMLVAEAACTGVAAGLSRLSRPT